VSDIPTWTERCEKHPDHQQGMVTHGMIAQRMQEEIDELREKLGAISISAEARHRINELESLLEEQSFALAEARELARAMWRTLRPAPVDGLVLRHPWLKSED